MTALLGSALVLFGFSLLALIELPRRVRLQVAWSERPLRLRLVANSKALTGVLMKMARQSIQRLSNR